MKYKLAALFALLFLATGFNLFAQVNVGSKELVNLAPGKIDPEDLADLKETKTVFVFTKKDNDEEQQNWRKVFQDVWTITPVEFIDAGKLSSYEQLEGYSFLSIDGVAVKSQTSVGTSYTSSVHLFLSLWMNKKKKNGKDDKKTFARIELFPDFTSAFTAASKKEGEQAAYLYKEAKFYNWYPGLLKNALRMVNNALKDNETKWLFGHYEDKEGLSNLKTETLYVPDYVLIDLGMMSAKETNRLDQAKLFKNYKGSYKILTPKELSDKILSDEGSIYYLLFVRSSTDKFVSVFNSKDGSLLYTDYTAMARNMSDGDFKDIQKLVDAKK